MVLLVGTVFVVFIGIGTPRFSDRGNALIQVAGRAVARDEFLRARAEQEEYLRRLAGDAFDARAAGAILDQRAAEAVVSRTILLGDAERLGLGVSREELRAAVRGIEGLTDASGQVDREAYERFYTYEFGSEAGLLRSVSDQLLVQKMIRLVASAAHVSEAEARDAALYGGEEIRLAFVALDALGAAGPEPSDEEVAAFAAAEPARIQARYDARRDEFQEGEAVRARHVLVRVARDAEEAQVAEARARAEALLERIRGGADLADVALEASEDPGTRERGGDLGFFGRGQMAPAFEEAAFGLEPGVVSDLVRSDSGFHVIRVEERREARLRPLDEVRDELARQILAEQRGGQRASERAEGLAAAVRGGRSLEEAARDEGLTLERSGWLRRRPDGFIPGLGASLPLQDTAFALRPEAASSPRIFEVGQALALIQLLERRSPEGEALGRASAAAREQLLEQRRAQLVDDWITARRLELQAEGQLFVNLAAIEEL